MGAGTNACRGVFGAAVDRELAYLLGEAVGTRLAAGRLVVGGDAQPGSGELQEAFVSGALRTGCTVYDVGAIPTPALYFAKDRLWADGAAMVTRARHAQDGSRFALSLGKLPAADLELAQLEQAVAEGGPFAAGRGRLLGSGIAEPYRAFLVAHFVPAQPLPVVVASECGSPLDIAQETLCSLGYPVHGCPRALEGKAAPATAAGSLLQTLCSCVSRLGAGLGVLYRDNGAQAVFVDETGSVLTSQQVLVLLSRALLRFEPGSQVICDERLGADVADQIRRGGGEPIAVRSGSTSVRRSLLERGAVLGADAEGRYCFRDMGAEDALYATLVMLRIVSHLGGALGPTLARLRI